MCLSPHTCKHTTFFLFHPSCPPPLLLLFPPPLPSLARHAASPIVDNVNGLSLPGVVGPLSSLAGKFAAATLMAAAHTESTAVCGGKEQNDVKGC